jgi:carboxymethylenebutenolidase
MTMNKLVWILLASVIAACAAAGTAVASNYADAMAREHAGDRPVAGAASGPAARGVHSESIERNDFRGYLARHEGEPRAGLIVLHEWWGLNDNIREMTRRLAAEGYLALAVDLYGGEVATDGGQARALMSAAMDNPDAIDGQLRAAYRWLREQGPVARVGSLGWCFGGALSLRTALLLPDELDAAVIYYGRLVTDAARLAPLEMPILGIFGGQDQGIPVESVLQFETTLRTLGKTAEIIIYDDADHAFANPSGTRYDPEAAEHAWQRTLAFLMEHLSIE